MEVAKRFNKEAFMHNNRSVISLDLSNNVWYHKTMSILVKKIGKKRYAYLAYRIGKKIVHKYLGPASSKEVALKIAELKSEKIVPEEYHHLFWDAEPEKIDIKKNARYIIERVLEIGGLSAFQWIQKIYPTRFIIEVCETSRKVSPKSKNFWRVWLGAHNAH